MTPMMVMGVMVGAVIRRGIQFNPAGDSPNFEAAAAGYRVIEFDGDNYTTSVVRLPQIKYIPELTG